MAKRTFEEYKKATKRVAEQAKLLMLVGHYNVDIEFLTDEDVGQVGECVCGNRGGKYYSIILRLYPKHFEMYQKNNDYKFCKTIIHELSHIITEPLYLEAYRATAPISRSYLEVIREQTTEQIANIVYNLWKK